MGTLTRPCVTTREEIETKRQVTLSPPLPRIPLLQIPTKTMIAEIRLGAGLRGPTRVGLCSVPREMVTLMSPTVWITVRKSIPVIGTNI